MKWRTSKDSHALAALSHKREEVIEDVMARTLRDIVKPSSVGALAAGPSHRAIIEEKIRDSFFWEKKRLEKPVDPIRDTIDDAFWKDIGSQVTRLDQLSDEESEALLRKIIRYHSQEIAGNYKEPVYEVATLAVPRLLSWLLRSLSVKNIASLFGGRMDLREKVHIEGQTELIRTLAQKGTVLLVPTHFSNLDSLLVGWTLFEIGLPPFCYGAGLNLFTNPVFGYFMNNLGAYKVDRRKKHDLYKTILKNYSTAIIEHGCHSLFFPSGGRSRSGGVPSRLKLGLLGTGLDAYINNLIQNKPNPNIYIVPCVLSYHFVLEAATLIDDYLAEQGKSRYIIDDDESSKPKVVAQFMYKFATASSKIWVNFGAPLDPFGHFVDEDGDSLNSHGAKIDITSFVRSNGEICHNEQRDQEYTKILGEKLVDRYLKENIALTSHFVAYTYFEYLKQKHSQGDIYRLFRLTEEETAVDFSEFSRYAEPVLADLHRLHVEGKILLEPALRSSNLKNILEAAIRHVGLYHTRRPTKLVGKGTKAKLTSEDVKLLYYYHNRMEGYHLIPGGRPQ